MKWLFGVTVLSLAGDVISKWLSASLLVEKAIRLGWLAELRCTQNTGMALGIFANSAWAGLLLPLAAILCGWTLMRRYRSTHFTQIACGLILGGFIGNYGQRILQGYVLDMIYFPWLPWFVCNVADICICFGVALLAFSLLVRPQDWEEKTRSTRDAQN